MADLLALRSWAVTVVDQLPPESESYPRAETAIFLIDWSLDAVDVMRLVLPMTDPRHQAHDMLTELLVRWTQAVG